METDYEKRIVNVLLLNSSFIENIGLMHGKMGISIFFFHLARKTKNSINKNYAGELIDEIYEKISTNIPANFENGLAGIGWGIEYLAQNGFIEADTDEMLEEFDNRLFQALIYKTPQEIRLLDGQVGLGAYFLKRIQNPISNDEKVPTLTNKQTYFHLIKGLKLLLESFNFLLADTPNCHLVLACDGNFKKVIELATPLSSQMNYLEFIPLNDLVSLDSEADIGLHSSLQQQCSYVVLGMLQCGLPVVASNLCELKRIFTHGENALLEGTIAYKTNI